MEKILEKLFDLNKIPTKLIIVVWFCTSIILFVPQQFLIKLNLDGFIKEYGQFIGISFLISSGVFIISIWTYINKSLKKRKHLKKIKKSILDSLAHLDSHEKALLESFPLMESTLYNCLLIMKLLLA